MTEPTEDLAAARNRRLAQLSREERARLFERLRAQKGAGGEGGAPIERIPRRLDPDAPAPLSFAQQRLWFLNRLAPGDPAYNISIAVRVTGPLDPEALHRALAGVAARHEALRTTFDDTPAGPVQVIHPPSDLALPVEDHAALAARDPAAADAAVRRRCSEESQIPFDLAAGPLLRATLHRLGERDHVLMLVMHHIVSDGWSMGILIREITGLYEPAGAPPRPELPELPIQYADFAAWQREHLSGEAVAGQLAYWRERLAGAPPASDLPADRPRPAVRSTRGSFQWVHLDPEPVRRLSLEHGGTPFIVLLAAYFAVIERWSGQTDLCVGTAVANRNRVDVSGLIGFFINNLVLRADSSENPAFRAFLAQVRATALGAYSNQDIPFEKLVEDLRPERDPSRSPLFQLMLILQNTPAAQAQTAELQVDGYAFDDPTAKIDLTFFLEERGERLVGSLNYNTDLFDAATMRRFGDHFQRAVAAVCADPGLRLSELPLLSEAELAQALAEEAAPAPGPLPELVPDRIARQARLAPHRPAVVFEETSLTYGELWGRAAALAGALRGSGAGPETRVALCLERSPEAIVGIVGILAAGAAYVPLDPTQPEDRLAGLLEQAKPVAALIAEEDETLPALLARAGIPALTVGGGALSREAGEGRGGGPLPPVEPESAAYVLFTSGSTGRPKGVVVEHRQLAAYVSAVEPVLQAPEGAAYALVSTLTADLGNTVLFPALCAGGCLHVLSRERALDPEAYADYAERHRLDVLKIVPSHLASLLKGTRPRRIVPRATLVLGGEAATWELVDRAAGLVPGVRILNHYGPTETTVGIAAGAVDPDPEVLRRERPALGLPLPGSRLLLLGRFGEPVPAGAPGELYAGGPGVARGYLGRPDLTAERFVPAPFGGGPGGRLYRTGDLARRLPDGRLEFLGRADDQVKVRGYRVEPREIEAALAVHPKVGRCAVLARTAPGGPGATLAAYIEPVAPVDSEEERRALADELRGFLAGALPGYMVPAAFAVLEALPLTANGKLDRQRLSRIAPAAERPAAGAAFSAPRTEIERGIAAIWSEVLGLERVGLHDNFFDLGGHSLLLTQAQMRLRETLGREVALLKFFELPTVGALAAYLEKAGDEAAALPETGAASRDRAQRQRQAIGLQRQRLAGRPRP